MKFVISEPKSGKAYSATTEDDLFVDKKLGEVVALDEITGMTGFEARITGGSDKQGFPMHPSVSGQARKKILTGKGIGFTPDKKGERKRVSVRGSAVSSEIAQVNLVITKMGGANLDELFHKEEKEIDTRSAKERALDESKKMAGSEEIGSAPIKKVRH